MIELKFYRHKTYKDLYLTRNGSVCGGGETTQFYNVTRIVIDALRSYDLYEDDFMEWYHTFPNNKTVATFIKNVEFDGYTGTLKKEIELPISEFELVTLREVEE